MSVIRDGVGIGAAAFALGLLVIGPQAAGVAFADAGAASSVGSGPTSSVSKPASAGLTTTARVHKRAASSPVHPAATSAGAAQSVNRTPPGDKVIPMRTSGSFGSVTHKPVVLDSAVPGSSALVPIPGVSVQSHPTAAISPVTASAQSVSAPVDGTPSDTGYTSPQKPTLGPAGSDGDLWLP